MGRGRFAVPLLLLALALLAPALCRAGDIQGRLGVGAGGGFMKLIGGDQDYSNVDQHGYLRVVRGLSRNVALELTLKYGWIRPGVDDLTEEAGLTFDAEAPFYTVIWQPEAGLLYRFAPDNRFCPFLGFAVGGTAWRTRNLAGFADIGLDPSDGPVLTGLDDDGERQPLSQTDFTAAVSAGADWFLSESLALNTGARYHMMPVNELDNVGLSAFAEPGPVDANTGMLEFFAGLTVFFGRPGAAAPPVAPPVAPEQPPVALDSDGDGIPDPQDRCPGEPETPNGIQDEDGCPELDGDGDGVLDFADACPGTPAGVAVGPDGCPLAEEIRASLVLEGVTFVTASAELTPQAHEVLTGVAASLKAYPEVRVEVQGHTDAIGSAVANRALSQARAESVRAFLIESGIAADRIAAVGYGEDYPVAPNDTEEGRARNRRVELVRTDL